LNLEPTNVEFLRDCNDLNWKGSMVGVDGFWVCRRQKNGQCLGLRLCSSATKGGAFSGGGSM